MRLLVLYEHASGYGLFSVIEMEEISMLQPQVEKSVTDFAKFASIVKLEAFAPFKSAAHALDNVNCVSEGIVSDDLKLFLETNIPAKKKKLTVGVGDAKIGAAITEVFGVKCQAFGVVPEILRGIRYHFHRMVKGLTAVAENKAQLGLGHSYSRAKVKFNVNRVDNMIIQSISLLDQLDKDINTFSMRIREWYSYHFPELFKIVSDNVLYAKCTKYIKCRKDLTEDKLDGLEEIVMDSAKVQAIYEASKSSMGMDISPIDLINIESFTSRVLALSDYRKKLHTYLREKMSAVAPNLAALIGDLVGARLISHAGSLTSLAKYPASTVQILGAEKALFRALKTKGNTPKYGLLFHSTFIGRAEAKNKGRISRFLANKCSIASRIDCFSESPTSIFGESLKGQIEERLKFYETGVAPRKNVDVMKEAVIEATTELEAAKKKKKKKKKRKSGDLENEEDAEPTPKKKKTEEVAVETPLKKKKKRKSEVEDVEEVTVSTPNSKTEFETPVSKKKKKKKSKENGLDESTAADADESVVMDTEDTPASGKKKKKKKKHAD
ncbi:nucleolar protein 56 [Saccoglossus kowalevskii]|uniref:Nucleolar protein 56 n=1 Tax=Saccoglossus kowalevskii TaxID=10224 RepID=A0ABM0H0L0_SACKO|nr:PREDICTED: nucleolar protein 56 [Saccoglossus kowalevskii]